MRQDNKFIIIDRMTNSRDSYKCEDKVSPMQWEISSDTLTVLGYLCQKATTTFRGRQYEAWFTQDIPVNDGPWKLYGLPGLILKANDSEKIFSFDIVGLEHISNTSIDMANQEYINCSRKDLEKLKKKETGGLALNFNDGNMVMYDKKNNRELITLEKE